MPWRTIDSRLGSAFWATNDVLQLNKDYLKVSGLDKDPEAVKAVDRMKFFKPFNVSKDLGLLKYSKDSGNYLYQQQVFDKAKIFGQRVRNQDENIASIAAKLGVNLEDFANELADMYILRLIKEDMPQDEIDKIKEHAAKSLDVLKAIFTSQELKSRLQEKGIDGLPKPLSHQGKLSILNAGLGCLNLIADEKIDENSVFEFVNGNVYNVANANDVLLLSLRTAKRARETFVDAAGIRSTVADMLEKMQEAKEKGLLSPGDFKEHSDHLQKLADKLIQEREELSKVLDFSNLTPPNTKEGAEAQIKRVREGMRAFRYDLDRISAPKTDALGHTITEKTKMTPMEKLRRYFDDIGRNSTQITAGNFDGMRQQEQCLNAAMKKISLLIGKFDPAEICTVKTAFSREHFDSVTNITHLANSRIRYYFSGTEQRLDYFSQKAYEVLSRLEGGGSRSVKIEAALAATWGFSDALEVSAGAKGSYTVKIEVDPVSGKVTLSDTKAGSIEGNAKLNLGTGGAKAKVEANASVGVKFGNQKVFASKEDFIAQMRGNCEPILRSDKAWASAIGGFFRKVFRNAGRKILGIPVSLRLKEDGSNAADNNAYAHNMVKHNVIKSVNEISLMQKNVMIDKMTSFVSMNANLSVSGSLELENVIKAGGSLGIGYSREFSKKTTEYRSIMQQARNYSTDWITKKISEEDTEKIIEEHADKNTGKPIVSEMTWLQKYGDLSGEDKESLRQEATDSILNSLREAEKKVLNDNREGDEKWLTFVNDVKTLTYKQVYLERMFPEGQRKELRVIAQELMKPAVDIPEKIFNDEFRKKSGFSDKTKHVFSFSTSLEIGKSNGLFGSGDDPSGLGESVLAGIRSTVNDTIDSVTPTSASIEYEFTRTTPLQENKAIPEANAVIKSHTFSFDTSVSVRALIESMAEKLIDSETTENKEEIDKNAREAMKNDIISTITESLALGAYDIIADVSVSSLADSCPKFADFIGSHVVTGAIDTEYKIAWNVTTTNGRVSSISTSDVSTQSTKFGISKGIFKFSIKDSVSEKNIGHFALIKPTLYQLISHADDYIKNDDDTSREQYKTFLTHNAPGVLRLHDAITSSDESIKARRSKGEIDKLYADDKKSFQENAAGAFSTIAEMIGKLDLLCADPDKTFARDELDRAQYLKARFTAAYEHIEHADSDAEKIDRMVDLAASMGAIFRFAHEMEKIREVK